MAVYPCSFAAHRYPQRQRSLYISDVAGGRPETRKHRVCPFHLQEARLYVVTHFSTVENESQPSVMCELCADQAAGPVFVKIYDEEGHEGEQYAIDLCPEHRLQVLTDLHWREALPVGANR